MKEEKDYLYWEYCDPRHECFRFDEDGFLVEILSPISSHLVKWLHNKEKSVKDSR